MAFLDRLFGFVLDATAGGKDYDALSAGAVPDSNKFYPVTGGNFDGGIERIDRNDEVRGRRANVPPRSFRAAPTMTVPVSCYHEAAEKIAYLALGVVSSTSGGTPPTPYTHTLRVLGYPTVNLPAVHTQMVRDTTNIKMAGATVNRVTFDFPLDGEGTMEIEFFGKFHDEFADASPTPTFTAGFSALADTLMLRDAKAYIDGSATQIPDLQGFSLTFTNNLVRKWYAGRNVVSKTLGTPTPGVRKLWFPAENKAQAAPEITYSLTFGNTIDEQEIKTWYAVTQKLEFRVTGLPIGGGYTGDEELQFVIWNGVNTDGGADDLSAREDITSRFEGGVFYSESAGKDLEIISITDTADLTA